MGSGRSGYRSAQSNCRRIVRTSPGNKAWVVVGPVIGQLRVTVGA